MRTRTITPITNRRSTQGKTLRAALLFTFHFSPFTFSRAAPLFTFHFSLFTLLLFSCTDLDPDVAAIETQVLFTTSGSTAAPPASRTTAGGDQWLDTDRVGIYMLTPGGTIPGNILHHAGNIAYKATPGTPASKATFTPVNESQTIGYPQTGTVDFIAYYPYTDQVGINPGQMFSDRYTFTVNGQTSVEEQNKMDLLRAKAGNISRSSTPIDLTFEHVLSKLTLNIKLGDGLATLTGTDITGVTLTGMSDNGILFLNDGSVVGTGYNDFPALKATQPATGSVATFSTLVIPIFTSNRTAIITVAGKQYTWKIPNDRVFAKGEHYTYTLTVQKTGIVLADNFVISPWYTIEHPSVGPPDIIKLPFETVPIPGNATMPGFRMGTYEITNAQYAEFLNKNNIGSDGIWAQGNYPTEQLIQATLGTNDWGLNWVVNQWVPAPGCENRPVVYVTWYGASAYAWWISQTYRVNCILPTSAQWEYACRAGTTSDWFFGDNDSRLDEYAWYQGNGDGKTHDIGGKMPNSYGLYDMYGNVFEWCADISGGIVTVRGSCFSSYNNFCTSSYITSADSNRRYNDVGFRVIITP